MKRRFFASFMAALSVILLSLALVGCSSSSERYEKLSSKFDEKNVKSAAESVVTLMNSGDYQKISDTMVEKNKKEGLSADVLKKAASSVLSKAGEFNSISSDKVTGVVDEKTKEEFAVSVLDVKYKNQTVQYEISFDTDMKIDGFFIK